MNALGRLALKELRDGVRNRWVVATILLLGGLALGLTFVGSAPAGALKASALDVAVVSLATLSVYLVPLIALMISFDAIIGEVERGTALVLLSYPVARWQVVAGKFFGQLSVLALAILVGYGVAGFVTGATSESGAAGWASYAAMAASSILLGAVFIALGMLMSALALERAMAAGLAVALWLVFVVLYDLGLLGLLFADETQSVSPVLFQTLLLVNPTDAYRVFNLTAFEGVAEAAGLAGLAGTQGVSRSLLIGLLVLWAAAPLGAAVALFQRKEL